MDVIVLTDDADTTDELNYFHSRATNSSADATSSLLWFCSAYSTLLNDGVINYKFPGVINVPIDVSAHARYM